MIPKMRPQERRKLMENEFKLLCLDGMRIREDKQLGIEVILHCENGMCSLPAGFPRDYRQLKM